MRTATKLKDIQSAIYHYRVARGRYLSDVPYEDLCREEIADIMADAYAILTHTEMTLKRVKWKGKRAQWRFMNRNGL
jgi:hypothetical protein